MRNDFNCFEDLISFVRKDKEILGAMAGTANRFPVRFVLFDNFQDSYNFVTYIVDSGCNFKNVNDWLDQDYPDTFLTYTELSNRILGYASSHTDDAIITPFSELARFYDNTKTAKQFDALVRTIKGIENTGESITNNRRIYIPIVGLEGKMSLFENDTQSTIWYLKNEDKNLSYNLILTNNTDFGVKDLSQYNVASSVASWLDVWKKQPAVTPKIICTSASIFANAEYAQPDNAFTFSVCNNAYEFLTQGLSLKFGEIIYRPSDDDYWQRMAREINDVNSFSFEKFFNSYFHIDNLADYNVFIKTWFSCNDSFEKWLLTTYYENKFCREGYICQVINQIENYSNSEFFSTIALAIFELENAENYLDERFICLQTAQKNNVVINIDKEEKLKDSLKQLAEQSGYTTAIRYFSPLTNAEKQLAIEWYANNLIDKDSLLPFFEDLYYYLGTGVCADQKWINEYFDAYREAKVKNQYTAEIGHIIQEKNAYTLSFNNWYQVFKTTKTVLSGREDIEIYYWIDGLGADWIPYIKQQLEQYQSEGIYLNEISFARAFYPTTTENNKKSLVDLSHNSLNKCGDLDSHAHQPGNTFPLYILEELEIVKKAINTIVSNYNGKKIAIVSDHGLTALSQFCDGLNMAGVESDHHGRLAFRKIGGNVTGADYIVCDEGKTLCALHHASLCGKVPLGQSSHGGCTPEEIIVPIFVISSNKENLHWEATLQTKSISENNPIVCYSIKGLSSVVSPSVEYNGKSYLLSACDNGLYESAKLQLNASIDTITLVIEDKKQIDKIQVNCGAEEDELFDFNI